MEGDEVSNRCLLFKLTPVHICKYVGSFWTLRICLPPICGASFEHIFERIQTHSPGILLLALPAFPAIIANLPPHLPPLPLFVAAAIRQFPSRDLLVSSS